MHLPAGAYPKPGGKRPKARETTGALALADAPEKAGKPAWLAAGRLCNLPLCVIHGAKRGHAPV